MTRPWHVALTGAALFAIIVLIGFAEKSPNDNSQKVLEDMEAAFRNLPDTASTSLNGNLQDLKMVSVGKDKMAFARYPGAMIIFYSDGKYAELLEAKKIKPLKYEYLPTNHN